MRRGLFLVLACVWIIGVTQLPRALEPGRAERAGVELNFVVDVTTGGVPHDWYRTDARTRAEQTPRGLTIFAGGQTLQLISRPLAVLPGRCYAAETVAAATDHAVLYVTDREFLTWFARGDLPEGTRPKPRRILFRTPDTYRLSLALQSAPGTTIRLERAAIALQPEEARCPLPTRTPLASNDGVD